MSVNLASGTSSAPAANSASRSAALRTGNDGKANGAAFMASFEAPPGFGVRQSSGAFEGTCAVLKAAEDCRTPKRWRATLHPELFPLIHSILCQRLLIRVSL